MDTGNRAAHVTQREFYSALTLVWTFIMLAFSTTVLSRSASPTRSLANVLYWAISLLMVANYAAASWRGGVSGKRVVIAMVLAVSAFAVGVVAFVAGGFSH